MTSSVMGLMPPPPPPPPPQIISLVNEVCPFIKLDWRETKVPSTLFNNLSHSQSSRNEQSLREELLLHFERSKISSKEKPKLESSVQIR